jgi:hypothetical protein
VAKKKPRAGRAKSVTPEKVPRHGPLWGGVVALTLAISAALLYFLYANPNPLSQKDVRPLPGGERKKGVTVSGGKEKTSVRVAAQLVGSTACAGCHSREYEE